MRADRLNRLINLTISDSRLNSLTFAPNPMWHQIARRVNGAAARLELSRGSLDIVETVTEQDGTPQVVKAAYVYYLDDEHWVFRYEYDLSVGQNKPHSHLHVNGQSEHVPDLPRIHFPAGRLSVEHLIFHLVEEHNVASRLDPDALVTMLRASYESDASNDPQRFP